MIGMSRGLGRWVFVLAGLAPFAMGQNKDRGSVAGQVVGLDGKPVPEAQVTLVHRPIGWCAQYGDVDVVRVATDARGRFRADVLPARPYSAFASWESGARPVATAVVELVAAGAFVTLQAQRFAIVSVTVRVDGQQPWSGLGPLGFRAMPSIAQLWPIPLTPNADGTVTLPTLPGDSTLLEVTTHDGHTLFSTWVPCEDRPHEVLATGPSTKRCRAVRLPPPVDIPLRVVDAATGKAVAGADIELRSSWLGYRVTLPSLDAANYSREYWRPVGKTDAEGRATVIVPAEAGPWPSPPERIHIALAVRAENYAMAFGGWNHEGAFWDGKVQSENPKPLQIPLHPQHPVTGRLTLDGTAPAAGVPVILWTDVTVTNKNGGGGSSWNAPVQFATTDAQGSFRFPYAPRGPVPLRVGVALDKPELRHRLAVEGLAPMLLAVPYREAGLPGAIGREEQARELGVASLGTETRVVVRLVDSLGSPMRGVEVFVLPAKEGLGAIATHNTTDGSGRCLLFPAAPGQLLVAVAPGLGYVIAPVAAEPAQEVRLVPFSVATGTVLHADGTAAARATLVCMGMRVAVPDSMDAKEAAIRHVIQRLNDDFVKGTCDSEGRFRLPYVPIRGVALRVIVRGDADERQTATVSIECDPDKAPAPFEVRLAR